MQLISHHQLTIVSFRRGSRFAPCEGVEVGWKFRRRRGLGFLKFFGEQHALRSGLLPIRPVFEVTASLAPSESVQPKRVKKKVVKISAKAELELFFQCLADPKTLKAEGCVLQIKYWGVHLQRKGDLTCKNGGVSEMRIRIWVDLGMTHTMKKCVCEHPLRALPEFEFVAVACFKSSLS